VSKSRARFLPHGKFLVVWWPYVVLGAALAAYYGRFDLSTFALLLVGVLLAGQAEHSFHVRVSSTLRRTYSYSLSDFVLLSKLGLLFLSAGVTVATVITLLTRAWLFPLFVAVGSAFLIGYFTAPREWFWGAGMFCVITGSMYALAHTLTLGACLLAAGICFLSNMGLHSYRLITGDYDHIEPGPARGIPKLIANFVLGLLLLAAGILAL